MDDASKEVLRQLGHGIQEAFAISICDLVLCLKNNRALRADQFENCLVSQLHRLEADPRANPVTVGILKDLLHTLDRALPD